MRHGNDGHKVWSLLTHRRTKDSGAQREMAPLLTEVDTFWTKEVLLLFGLSFPSVK